MFIKYPKIKILGDRSNEGIFDVPGKVVIQEKVDGANFGFFVLDKEIYFCSHNNNLTDSIQIRETGIPKKWRGVESVYDSFCSDASRFNENYYYYGESMQKHSLSYDNINGFIGFDIFDMETELFLPYSEVRDIFQSLNLEFINVYCELSTENLSLDKLVDIHKVSHYKDGKAEGIVIKRIENGHTGLCAKIVDSGFGEQQKAPKVHHDYSNEMAIADEFCTRGRIIKIIHKLEDDGEVIEMPIMRKLIYSVTNDILEEEIIYISQNYKSIDFKAFNKSLSRNIVKILKKYIMTGDE